MSWTDEYREIVEFYYWEPQHIGRTLNGKRFKNADEMYEHIHRLEVSLNQILNIFFSLYPIMHLDCFSADTSHDMLSSWQLEQYIRQQKNSTQPDLFFVGNTKNIAIELKTASKSNLGQILKYIHFNEHIGAGTSKPLELYFLTSEQILAKVFKEKYETVDSIYKDVAMANSLVPLIKLITYNDFFHSIKKLIAKTETEKRLISGLIFYLISRKDQLKIII